MFANSTAEPDAVLFFGNEAAPIAASDPETKLRRVMLAPYGDWPNRQGLQKFQKPDAENIVKEFSNVVSKILNPQSWLGLPWYEGHPDHPDFRGKPGHVRATAVGRIKSLEAGNDGLYANVRFNDDGESLIRNESYHGHSVNWFLTRDNGGNGYRPFKLKSVGFTNEPNIPVPAVTTANAWSDAAREAALQKRKENLKAGEFGPLHHHGALAAEVTEGVHTRTSRQIGSSVFHFVEHHNPRQAAHDFHDFATSEAAAGAHDVHHAVASKSPAVVYKDDDNIRHHVKFVNSSRQSANSSLSRFSVMAAMRGTAANAWSDAARKAALEARRATEAAHSAIDEPHLERHKLNKIAAKLHHKASKMVPSHEAGFHQEMAEEHHSAAEKLLDKHYAANSRLAVMANMRASK